MEGVGEGGMVAEGAVRSITGRMYVHTYAVTYTSYVCAGILPRSYDKDQLFVLFPVRAIAAGKYISRYISTYSTEYVV